jgi:hypothetical protein
MAVGATAGDMPGATAMVAVARAVGATVEAARAAAAMGAAVLVASS